MERIRTVWYVVPSVESFLSYFVTMTKEQINMQAVNIIQDLRSIISYHRSAGIDTYHASEDIDRFLSFQLEQKSAAKSPVNVGHDARSQPRNERPVQVKQPKQKTVEDPKLSLGNIREEVVSCTGCSLHASRTVAAAGGGGERARMLIVGDWLVTVPGRQVPSGTVFGIEQDRMLGKMLDAIQFPRDQVFVSNVIKCGVPATCQPKAEHVRSCLSYLHRQIAVIQPEIILTMGMISTRTLLDRRDTLSKLRGRLHSCITSEGKTIPLIATYHPTFLLQNPEMKRATWYDLQMLAKQLERK